MSASDKYIIEKQRKKMEERRLLAEAKREQLEKGLEEIIKNESIRERFSEELESVKNSPPDNSSNMRGGWRD